jgi:hypothetical protein
MKFSTMFAGAAISTALALCAVQANATTLKFTVTGSDNYSWLQDSAPTPTISNDQGTTVSAWDSVAPASPKCPI